MSRSWVLALMVLAWCGGSASRADVLLLNSGGVIRGTWLNDQAEQPAQYSMRTEQGAHLTIDADQVRRLIREPEGLQRYREMAPNLPDTIDGHWKIAEWCRSQGLDEQRRVHLERLLELAPNHAAARRALGYSQVGGRWITKAQFMKENGYVVYRGRWRLAQEIELLEEKRKLEVAERTWHSRIRRWRKTALEKSSYEASRKISQIRDPHAIKALTDYYKKEPFRSFKLLYVEALAGISTPGAINVLIQASLNEPDDEVFHTCLDRLVERHNEDITREYMKALRDGHNFRVNRAALALERLDDKTAVTSLIDALVTTHQVVIPPPGGQSGSISSTFGRQQGPPGTAPLDGFGMSAGRRPKIVPVQRNNHSVPNALVQLSDGVSFGFDRRAWKYWYQSKNERTRAKGLGRDG